MNSESIVSFLRGASRWLAALSAAAVTGGFAVPAAAETAYTITLVNASIANVEADPAGYDAEMCVDQREARAAGGPMRGLLGTVNGYAEEDQSDPAGLFWDLDAGGIFTISERQERNQVESAQPAGTGFPGATAEWSDVGVPDGMIWMVSRMAMGEDDSRCDPGWVSILLRAGQGIYADDPDASQILLFTRDDDNRHTYYQGYVAVGEDG